MYKITIFAWVSGMEISCKNLLMHWREGVRVQAPDGYICFDKDGKAYFGDMDKNGDYKQN